MYASCQFGTNQSNDFCLPMGIIHTLSVEVFFSVKLIELKSNYGANLEENKIMFQIKSDKTF